MHLDALQKSKKFKQNERKTSWDHSLVDKFSEYQNLFYNHSIKQWK